MSAPSTTKAAKLSYLIPTLQFHVAQWARYLHMAHNPTLHTPKNCTEIASLHRVAFEYLLSKNCPHITMLTKETELSADNCVAFLVLTTEHQSKYTLEFLKPVSAGGAFTARLTSGNKPECIALGTRSVIRELEKLLPDFT